jgi:hypothetical protein
MVVCVCVKMCKHTYLPWKINGHFDTGCVRSKLELLQCRFLEICCDAIPAVCQNQISRFSNENNIKGVLQQLLYYYFLIVILL